MSAFGIDDPGPEADPWESAPFKAWAKRVRAQLVPKIADSALTVSIFSGKVDVKIAVEIGFTLLLGKPLILAVEPGAAVPDALARAADAIVEVDLTRPGRDVPRLQAAIAEVLAARGDTP